jgi:transposase
MVRLKSFFLTYDIEIPEEAGAHWSGAFEAWLLGLKLEDRSLDRVLEELRGLYFDLDARVDALTKELRQMARSADFAPTVELLSTVPGIGWLTALTLAVEIVDFSRFPDGEALSSYAGLTPPSTPAAIGSVTDTSLVRATRWFAPSSWRAPGS